MKKPEVKWKAFLASVLFHLVLAVAIIVGLPDVGDPLDAVEVSIMDIDDDSPDIETSAAHVARLAATSKPIKKSIKKGGGALKLFPGLDLSAAKSDLALSNNKTEAKSPGRYSYSDSRSYDTDISEIFGDDGNVNWSHFREIYTKVDANLNFDSILAQYNHFGRVFVQFELDENGVLKKENLKVTARDSILKVHVLRAIRKSFDSPNGLLNAAKGEKGLLYQARFDFNFGNYQQNFLKQKEFGRPVFSFKRFTEEKPVPEELLEQLLSGGVSPNISAMYERWQKYNEKKRRKATEFDPFSSYKIDPFYSL